MAKMKGASSTEAKSPKIFIQPLYVSVTVL
jgi:hypothetical protein